MHLWSSHIFFVAVQVQALESNLYGIQDEFEKLKNELKDATNQLSNCVQEKKSLESELEDGRKKYEQSCAQRKALQVITIIQLGLNLLARHFAKYKSEEPLQLVRFQPDQLSTNLL